jgi:hypothetical protein
MHKMKIIRNWLKITAIFCISFLLLSCHNRVGDSEKSGVILTVTRIMGMDAEGNDADYLASDVQTGGSYLTNPVAVTLEAKLKKPEPLVTEESYKTSVMIDRYTVTYMTSYDGGGTEGVDVPYSFEGSLSAVCEVDGSVDLSVLAVRAEAKAVAPLNALIGTLNVIWCVARFDFIGHDLAGNQVQATGYLTIYFADWADI